jgi:hypothetical protein
MEAYMLAQDKANEKLKAAGAKMHEVYKDFAAKNNINLIDAKDETSEKVEKVDKVNSYYHDLFLIFFKSNKQYAYLMKAIEDKNLNGIEQNRNTLQKYSEEGLAKLTSIKAFDGDPSVLNSCKKMLQFYVKAAQEKITPISDFLVKNDNFNEIKKTFDTKAQAQRTKEDVHKYNKAADEMNKAVTIYNKSNKELYDNATNLNNEWNNSVQNFMDKHMPFAK